MLYDLRKTDTNSIFLSPFTRWIA